MSKTTENIRRLKNGAIDTAYYVNRSHVIRSRAAHRSFNRIKDDAASDILSIKGFIRKRAQYLYFGRFGTRKVVHFSQS